MSTERYNPVPLDLDATRKQWMKDPAFADAYNALEDEYATLRELLRARQQAGLTQAEVAERMGVAQASVARLESSAGSRKHAPSISTLRRYAAAVGCDLRIVLAPKPAPAILPARRKAVTR
jgi:DNA-binding XRE family transcriptional regulator